MEILIVLGLIILVSFLLLMPDAITGKVPKDKDKARRPYSLPKLMEIEYGIPAGYPPPFGLPYKIDKEEWLETGKIIRLHKDGSREDSPYSLDNPAPIDQNCL